MGIPRKVSDLGELSPAERQVLRDLDTGEPIILGNGVPATDDEPRKVRASLIRLLLLSDDPEPKYRLHETGLRISGAWIPDVLDLKGCRDLRDLGLIGCRFEAAPVLRSTGIVNLVLSGSHLPGLIADRLEAKGGVFLRGVTVTGGVRLLGAKLGGDLSCTGATFRATKDAKGNPREALAADRLEAKGGVFLRDIVATGAVRLLGAKLGGNLECIGATFRAEKNAKGNPGFALIADGLEAKGDVFLSSGFNATGQVRLVGANLGGDLSCEGATFRAENDAAGEFGKALDLSNARISGAFFLRGGTHIVGVLDLSSADIGHFNDETGCWPGAGCLILDRCRYGAFTGGPVDAVSRLTWLGLQDPGQWGKDFWPQPYEQCAEVLQEMGHSGEARKVLIEKERRQRAARREGFAAQLSGARLRMRTEKSGAGSVWPDVVAAVNSLRASDPRRAVMIYELRRSPQVRARLAGQTPQLADLLEDVADRIVAARAPIWDYWWRLNAARVWDGLIGATIGYGRAPQRAAIWAAGFLLLGWLVFAVAAGHGAIKPN